MRHARGWPINVHQHSATENHTHDTPCFANCSTRNYARFIVAGTGSAHAYLCFIGGHQTNPCTLTAPCASFATAYAATAANGIIAALDPGKYGPLTINGPVTINGNGWAAITAPSGGNGITINAVSGNVILTGLEIDGAEPPITASCSTLAAASPSATASSRISSEPMATLLG